MQVSQTYNYDKNDHINRANMALICSEYYNIRDVSPSLYQIAAPVSEIPCATKDGMAIWDRNDVVEAIPWDERSMKTFCVVYSYESTASFIGIDGKTYVVPNDRPVLDHLQECGYLIAPHGKNLDGSVREYDSLILEIIHEGDDEKRPTKVDKNLPPKIVDMIDEMESGRPYCTWIQPYDGASTFGGSFGLRHASKEELQQLSLSERKVANINTYKRIKEPQNIDEYVQYVLQQKFLNEQTFRRKF